MRNRIKEIEYQKQKNVLASRGVTVNTSAMEYEDVMQAQDALDSVTGRGLYDVKVR